MNSAGREALLALLDGYAWKGESALRDRFREFVANEPRCFENNCWAGHITGSAWVLSRDSSETLLLLHTKLGKWLQPGGHSDGNSDTCAVAMREAWEETGVKVELASLQIFDLDVHQIPARGSDPEHLHFDVRFALWADRDQLPRASDESQAVRWTPLAEVAKYTKEESVLRMVRKTPRLAYGLGHASPANRTA